MAQTRERPDVEFFAQVAVVGQQANLRLERALPAEVSMAGFGVLSHLALWGGTPTPNELARAFLVTKGAMTNTLQRLEAEGYVRVTADAADGRRKRVALTPAGRTAHQQALTSVRPQIEALRGAFDPVEFEAALPFLRRLRTWLDDR
jgi:DNA-binding MarR family transcriptional regulator